MSSSNTKFPTDLAEPKEEEAKAAAAEQQEENKKKEEEKKQLIHQDYEKLKAYYYESIKPAILKKYADEKDEKSKQEAGDEKKAKDEKKLEAKPVDHVPEWRRAQMKEIEDRIKFLDDNKLVARAEMLSGLYSRMHQEIYDNYHFKLPYILTPKNSVMYVVLHEVVKHIPPEQRKKNIAAYQALSGFAYADHPLYQHESHKNPTVWDLKRPDLEGFEPVGRLKHNAITREKGFDTNDFVASPAPQKNRLLALFKPELKKSTFAFKSDVEAQQAEKAAADLAAKQQAEKLAQEKAEKAKQPSRFAFLHLNLFQKQAPAAAEGAKTEAKAEVEQKKERHHHRKHRR